MEDERARILRMVAEGSVTPEEAASLLEALQPARAAGPGIGGPEAGRHFGPSWGASPPEPASFRKNRHLVIYVKDGGESRVNIRIPLGLTKVAGKFIPRHAQSFLTKYDINLQEFLESAGSIDSGTVLEIKDGENRVLIAVE